MRTPFVIAEFGSCHEQSFTRALEGIAVAKRADADAVKYQYWSSPQRMRERRHMDDPQAYERGSVLTTWLPLLSDEAHKRGLEFMATCYLPEDIKIVAPYVDRFKLASFEARDPEMWRALKGYEGHVVVSLGMMNDEDIEDIPDLTWTLHCVSAYPTPLEEASLGAIWGGHGYSDHTNCLYTGGFAVSAGADMLEVHYRLDDTSKECPDYVVAHPPASLTEYIRLARLAHTMRGDGVERPQPSERVNMKHRVLG